jgi:serine/threonine protein kinase
MGNSFALATEDDATRALRKSTAECSPPLSATEAFAQPQIAGDSARPPSLAESRIGQRLLSYELGPRIGAGGMGVVYQATHVWLGRTVAIKFISAEVLSDPEAITRFRGEARAIGGLDHPNIVRATDAGCVDGVHFLVTEYIEGCDLAWLVKQRGPLAAAEACEVIRQAALGLQHAHEQGFVHRDVKPSNLRVDRSGVVKLLDFGLARMAAGQTTMTGTGQMLGTLDFLAPEQASDARNVDIRADIYSLGCTLYFLLTGSPPFSGPEYDTPASKIKGHLADPPQPMAGRCTRLPLAVTRCLQRMMAKDPRDRYRTPAEVVQAITPCVKNAGLGRLVQAATESEFGGRSNQAASRTDRTITEEYIDLATGAFDLVRRGFRRIFIGKPSYGGQTRQGPLISFSGVVALGFIAFVFSQITCVPMGPGGMPGMGPPGNYPPGMMPPNMGPPNMGPPGTWRKISSDGSVGVFVEPGEPPPRNRPRR